MIAAELAFAQLAQDKGQWTAFRETAAVAAVMFVPQMVYAQGWLKDRANPATAVKWQPHAVWSSCDGSLVVSHGAWQGARGQGYFTTIWQRQGDGTYKWVLDSGDVLAKPLAAPEFLSALVADCPARGVRAAHRSKPGKPPKPPKFQDLPALDPAQRSGRSSDGTLTWQVTVTPAGARRLTASWTRMGKTEPLLDEEVAAPQG